MRTVYFLGLAVIFVACLSVGTSLALDPFSDNFDRADNDTVGNGWEELEDDGIPVVVANGEVLVAGTQDVDWERNGIARNVNDISSLSFDFLADDVFNVHMRIDDTSTGAFIEPYAWPGGPFSQANSADGSWPGWVAIEGSDMMAGQYNTLAIERVAAGQFQIKNNGTEIVVLENAGLVNIDRIQLSADSAAGSVGSLHIDNVVIDGAAAIEPADKLSTAWGKIKSSL